MSHQAKLTLIIRPDGTVPFDPAVFDAEGRHVSGLHPDVKRQIIGHLVETGHVLEHHPQGHSVKLLSGPHAPSKGE
jgi:hypothetical protein